jgi:hypothetical protein
MEPRNRSPHRRTRFRQSEAYSVGGRRAAKSRLSAMAAKPLDIHPAVLTELKSAVTWYDKRSASAGDGFVAEIDRAIESSPPP